MNRKVESSRSLMDPAWLLRKSSKPSPKYAASPVFDDQLLCLGYFIAIERKSKTRQRDQWDKNLRPFRRLRASTARPPLVFIRARKPCRRLRLRCDGWYSLPRVIQRTCCIAGSAMSRTREPVVGASMRDGCCARGPRLSSEKARCAGRDAVVLEIVRSDESARARIRLAFMARRRRATGRVELEKAIASGAARGLGFLRAHTPPGTATVMNSTRPGGALGLEPITVH